MLTETDLFQENFYRTANPDVAVAIANGIFRSGFDHFKQFGQFERRNPSAFFDSNFYLQQNQDVANAVAVNATTAFSHFVTFGQSERRNSNLLFDTNFYLNNNSDVAAAVQRDALTGIEHYVKFGAKEGRNPSRFFDNNFYLNRNSDVSQAVRRDIITGVEHYIEFGQFEGRIPRNLFDRMFVFGDSLSDDGNVFVLTGGTIPPTPPYFNGHFSNGPIWAENLAPQLRLTVNPDNNFAVSSATTGSVNTASPLLPGLQQQIDNFVSANQTSVDPKGIYAIWIGANDYLGGTSLDIGTTVNNIGTAVTKLAEAGAKNFMLLNLPNFGLTPRVAATGSANQQAIGQAIDFHNRILAATIPTLEQSLKINIIPVDVNSLFNNITANPSVFGFTNITSSVLPGFPTDPNLRNFSVPAGINPNQYVFWDTLHPTARVHELIADKALKATTAISEVVSIL